jgi:hypothetical protein
LEELLKILALTGQLQAWRHLRTATSGEWGKLTAKQRGELVWAVDALDWSFLSRVVEQSAAPPAGPRIWQITDALPQLSAEPFESRGPRERAAGLKRLVGAHETTVAKALRAGQVAAAAQLAAAEGVAAADAAAQLQELRGLLQGSLGLSTGGKAVRGQEVRFMVGAFPGAWAGWTVSRVSEVWAACVAVGFWSSTVLYEQAFHRFPHCIVYRSKAAAKTTKKQPTTHS